VALIHESDAELRRRGLDPVRVRNRLRRADPAATARELGAEYSGQSPAERLAAFAVLCRSLPAFLAVQPDGGTMALCRRDPLPPSSLHHLARLRGAYRGHRVP